MPDTLKDLQPKLYKTNLSNVMFQKSIFYQKSGITIAIRNMQCLWIYDSL